MTLKVGSGATEPTARRTTPVLWATLGIPLLLVGGLVVSFVSSLHLTVSHVDVTMHPTAIVVGRTVRVTGTTDLPDGAVIGYSYVHELPDLQGQEPEGGLTTIHNSRFDFETDFAGWPGGAIRLYTEFGVGSGWDQAPAVIDRLGADGERISGPQAYTDSGDPPHFLATTTFVLPQGEE